MIFKQVNTGSVDIYGEIIELETLLNEQQAKYKTQVDQGAITKEDAGLRFRRLVAAYRRVAKAQLSNTIT